MRGSGTAAEQHVEAEAIGPVQRIQDGNKLQSSYKVRSIVDGYKVDDCASVNKQETLLKLTTGFLQPGPAIIGFKVLMSVSKVSFIQKL